MGLVDNIHLIAENLKAKINTNIFFFKSFILFMVQLS